MGDLSVDQIMVTPLQRIPLVGGDVLHAMKSCDPGFVGFGEAYFSIIEAASIKGWKRHLRMTLNLVVPVGSVHFVFMDEQGGVREVVLGETHYARLTIPPTIWFGFKGLVPPYSLLMNVADIPHDPAEIERKAVDEIQFDWERKL